MKSKTGLNRLQRFLVRNCGILTTAELASYLQTDEVVIRGWFRELGLPEIEPMDRERRFPLVVRRNHEILPEEEIAELLGMPISLYRKTMLEMDCLDLKVGVKPPGLTGIKADREDWSEPAAAHFKSCCERHFSDYPDWEKPFSSLDGLQKVEPALHSAQDESKASRLGLRMMYSYAGTHGDFLLTGEEFYGDGILSRLRNRGVNAGWMPALLRDLAPSTFFPEFGEGHEIRIANLRKQVEKAGEYGIRLFLYLNEPRFMPEDFFLKYPDSRGMTALQSGYYGMCTSDDRVRSWLHESLGFIFSQVPDLGGVIVITASENRTNCCSHAFSTNTMVGNAVGLESRPCTCPRCAQRNPADVLADAANVFSQALVSIQSKAEVIQWLWGWDFVLPVDQVQEALVTLSDGVTVMVDWARHTKFNLLGKEAKVIEYTLAHVQPSDYALGIVKTAKSLGKRVLARCSLVSTAEMNALPYLPVLSNVEELLLALQEQEVDGLLGCWIFGSYPGRNMEMLAHVGDASPTESLATKYYGSSYREVVKAWGCFSEGMKYYPTLQCACLIRGC